MRKLIGRAALLAVLAGMVNPAFAIHIEQDHEGLQSPQARFAAEARSADGSVKGGLTTLSGSAFTGLNAEGLKRKRFPAGYSRSGYSFADEDLGAETEKQAPPPTQENPAAQPTVSPDAPIR